MLPTTNTANTNPLKGNPMNRNEIESSGSPAAIAAAFATRTLQAATPKFTELEAKVLTALIRSASGNGNDFGLIEDARNVCRPEQLGGVVASLSKKGIIHMHDTVTTDSGTWTQFTWPTGTDGEHIIPCVEALPLTTSSKRVSTLIKQAAIQKAQMAYDDAHEKVIARAVDAAREFSKLQELKSGAMLQAGALENLIMLKEQHHGRAQADLRRAQHAQDVAEYILKCVSR
jgi:hypothetical protein